MIFLVPPTDHSFVQQMIKKTDLSLTLLFYHCPAEGKSLKLQPLH